MQERKNRVIQLNFSEVPAEVVAINPEAAEDRNMIFAQPINYDDSSQSVTKIARHLASIHDLKGTQIRFPSDINQESPVSKLVKDLKETLEVNKDVVEIILSEHTIAILKAFIDKNKSKSG